MTMLNHDGSVPDPSAFPKATENIDSDALIRGRLYGKRRSAFRTYRELTLEDCGILRFFWYEFITTLLGPLPGMIGLALRSVFYPSLFKTAGKGVVFGRNLTIRNPHRICLGQKVILDDYVLIDGRGAGLEGVLIGDRVIVNRNACIQAKWGAIRIGDDTNVGAGSLIVSMGGVEIGSQVGIAGGCYISGGQFQTETTATGDGKHAKITRGPIRLGDRCWLGMRATVLDGTSIGEDTIVGVGAVVTQSVPASATVLGNPARVVQKRQIAAKP